MCHVHGQHLAAAVGVYAANMDFHLAHGSKLEAIVKGETKTDSVDAWLLARMLATGLIPEVYPKRANRWVRGALISAIPNHLQEA